MRKIPLYSADGAKITEEYTVIQMKQQEEQTRRILEKLARAKPTTPLATTTLQ